ncbi:hypothetical protein N7467_010918 [Penicillium canescens]|nr:hypothetical protein N7467_010918 [Penicillium canescens]
MPFQSLPLEVIRIIAWELPSDRDFLNLICTNSQLCSLLMRDLYKRNLETDPTNTALDWCATTGCMSALYKLAHWKPDFNRPLRFWDKFSNKWKPTSALVKAVENNNAKTVLFLLKNGADPNYGNGISDHTLEKLTPLEIAAERCAYMSAERLLSHGAKIDQSILYRAITSGGRYTWVCGERAGATSRLHGEYIDPERTVRVILDHGAILNDPTTVWSPLHEAVESYHYPGNGVIRWLLDHGADVNSRDALGRSPMFYAFKTEYRNPYQRSKKMVELLLEYGAEPSPEELGEHLFGSQYSFEMTKLLLDLGADVNILNHDDMTPLHLLLSRLDSNGHFEQLEPEEKERLTRLFISHGADVLLKDCEGNTPLHLALDPDLETMANANTVKQLLDAGAKVLCQSEDGFDPLLALLDHWPDSPYADDDFDASNPMDYWCQEWNRD